MNLLGGINLGTNWHGKGQDTHCDFELVAALGSRIANLAVPSNDVGQQRIGKDTECADFSSRRTLPPISFAVENKPLRAKLTSLPASTPPLQVNSSLCSTLGPTIVGFKSAKRGCVRAGPDELSTRSVSNA